MIAIWMWACMPTEPVKYGEDALDTGSATDTTDTGSVDDTSGTVPEDTENPSDTQDTQDTVDTSPADPNAIEIYGAYFHQGNEHFFGNTAYTVDYGGGEVYTYNYIQFSNPQRWLVAENSASNFGEAGYYSRFDWNIDASGTVWVCQTTAMAETAQEAQYTPAANPFNITGGCAGGPWMQLD